MWGLSRELLSSRFFLFLFFKLGSAQTRSTTQTETPILKLCKIADFKNFFIASLQPLKKLFEISIKIDLANLHLPCFCLIVKAEPNKRFDFIGFDSYSIAGKSDRFAPLLQNRAKLLCNHYIIVKKKIKRR